MDLLTKLLTLLFVGWMRRREPEARGYVPTGPLLTPAERLFHATLCQAVGRRAVVMPKVRLYDVARPATGDGGSHALAMRQHLDFVLADPTTLLPLAAVELDDSTHKSLDARQRDSVKDAALTGAGIPIYRVKARHSYSVDDLTHILELALSRSTYKEPGQHMREQ